MTLRSALYTGQVVHDRARPKRHRLRYRVFMLLLDLDEIDALDARLKRFARGRLNLISFHDRDRQVLVVQVGTGDDLDAGPFGDARDLRPNRLHHLPRLGVAHRAHLRRVFCQ